MKKNESKMEEIKNLRVGEEGKVNLNNKEAKNIVNDKKSLERENRNLRKENLDYKMNLKFMKNAPTFIINAKIQSIKIELKRYNKIIGEIDEVQEKVRGFLRNIQKERDNLVLHTACDEIPITNNC